MEVDSEKDRCNPNVYFSEETITTLKQEIEFYDEVITY